MPIQGIPGDDGQLLCGACLASPPPYDRARFGFVYGGSMSRALLRFKYHGGLDLTRWLSDLLIEAYVRYYREDPPDLVVPVPMHRAQLVRRGYNQVVELGKRLCRSQGLGFDRYALVKIRRTEAQVGLSRAARLTNLHRAFAVNRPDRVRDKRVLLLDDVSTTGTTIGEAARVLHRAGARNVRVLVLALRSLDQESGKSGAEVSVGGE
jgi:ComF family protein